MLLEEDIELPQLSGAKSIFLLPSLLCLERAAGNDPLNELGQALRQLPIAADTPRYAAPKLKSHPQAASISVLCLVQLKETAVVTHKAANTQHFNTRIRGVRPHLNKLLVFSDIRVGSTFKQGCKGGIQSSQVLHCDVEVLQKLL